ncbi:membrane protein [hydrothermal vent metagenome]|uniref:Membrane protein n=1 Tax=hydrothermal vent metagenome TaxID=652676 RepID=A0A1W1BDK0_9ZZZZ
MSEALKKLKTLGSQKVYMDTHIPAFYIEAILDENFQKFVPTQFFGFVSILEREYAIDLEELKAHAREYYDKEVIREPLAEKGVLVSPPKEKKFMPLYIVLAIFIFLLGFYYTNSSSKEEINSTLPQEVEKVAVEIPSQQKQKRSEVVAPQVQKSSLSVVATQHEAKEENLTQPIETKEKKVVALTKVTPPKRADSLEILPRSRVWLGYINVATHKRYQKTFADRLDLNASKEWIFLSGHGYIDAIVNGKKIHFSSKNGLRLHYKDGRLEKISKEEFKRLNRGRGW